MFAILFAQLESSHTRRWGKIAAIMLAVMVTFISSAEARKVSRVIIDPGHGGKDKGAHRGSVYEKDLALKVAFLVEKMLKEKGMPVTMTRRNDQFISLRGRADIANRYNNAIFISIHFNAHTGTSLNGVETYYHSDLGQKLAAHVHLRMLSQLQPRNGNTRQRKDLGVLKATRCPAILVECGYISNPAEATLRRDCPQRKLLHTTHNRCDTQRQH